MSYLSALVGAPPAASRPVAAAAAPDMVASLEQHVEVEAAAPARAEPAAARQAAAPAVAQPAAPMAMAQPEATVDDALQAAFAWVVQSPQPDPARSDPVQQGMTAVGLEVHMLTPSAPPQDEALAAPADRRGPAPVATTPHRPRPTAPTALTRPQRDAPPHDAPWADDEADEPQRRAPHPGPEAVPGRAHGAAARALPAAEDDVPSQRGEQQPSGVHVHIGSIALTVRTPPAPPAPAQAAPAAPAAAPAATESARPPSPAFAFSARRHHLRWS